MAASSDGEFNPWPAFVDIFSSVILCLLLFLMVVLANLGYFSQFKYKVSYTGSVSSDDIIKNNNQTNDEDVKVVQKKSSASSTSPTVEVKPNSDLHIKIINEQKQMVLALEHQISTDPNNVKSAKGTDEVESAGNNVSDKKENTAEIQKMISSDDYFVITYKADEFFVDDNISKQLKEFLAKAKSKTPSHKVNITVSDIQNQLSATISKQISLARTMSVRNLIRKFGYEKKDLKIDLANPPEIKETIDSKNGYLVIKIEK